MNYLRPAFDTLAFRLLALFLLFLTIMALLPWTPQGPFDARDYHTIEGVSLSYPWWGALLEPLFAPAQVLVNSPNYHLTIVVTLFWVVAAAIGLPIWQASRDFPRPSRRSIARRVGINLMVSLVLYFAYVIAAAVVYFPGWTLEVENPEWLVADLQSHTIASHDGLVTAEKSFSWHADRGYDLFAVTEHDDPGGSFTTRDLANRTEGAPAVIPGVEVNNEDSDFLLGIGLKNGKFPRYGGAKDTAYSHRFIENIHRRHDGAAIALSWKLEPEKVGKLVAAGIDGFEIVNSGHPDVSQKLRDEMLRAEKEDGVVLIASTDWHGWSGYSRTWTLVHIPDAAKLNNDQIAARTVQLLRERKQEAFVPVVAGYMGPVPWLRTAFSPLFEIVRYGAELSPARLIAWWGWFFALAALYGWLREKQFAVVPLLLGSTSLLLSIMLLQRALELHGWWPGMPAATEVTLEVGGRVFWVGLLSLGVATAYLLPETWHRYRRRKVPWM